MIDAGTWDDLTHARCDALVSRIVAPGAAADVQARSWSELFALIAADLERWSRSTPLLRRAGLASEDDWRAVFLRVVERLVRRQYANLRAYRESCEAHRAAGTLGRTPLEAWLRQLVRYAAADEVERCLAQRRTRPAGGAATVEGLGQRRVTQPSAVTAVAAKQRSVRLRAALQELDDDQRCALLRRVQGAGYDDIAGAMGVSAREAHDLVRAAKACLRRSLRQARAAGER